MNTPSARAPRRAGVTAIHSLDRFVFTVPDVDVAQRFYGEFGLDARRDGERLDLYALGHAHCWASIYSAPGPKKLQYLRFGVYADDLAPLRQRLQQLGVAARAPHRLGDGDGAWLADPDGNVLQVVAAAKVSAQEAGGACRRAGTACRPRRGAGAKPGRARPPAATFARAAVLLGRFALGALL